MAKPRTPAAPLTFPDAGGSYVRQPGGKLDQVEGTKPPPDVQVQVEEPAPAIVEPASKEL